MKQGLQSPQLTESTQDKQDKAPLPEAKESTQLYATLGGMSWEEQVQYLQPGAENANEVTREKGPEEAVPESAPEKVTWRTPLIAAWGQARFDALQQKLGGRLYDLNLAFKSDPDRIAIICDHFEQARARTVARWLAKDIAAHEGAFGLTPLLKLIDLGLDLGWTTRTVSQTIASLHQAGMASAGYTLVRAASGAGWSQAQLAECVAAAQRLKASADDLQRLIPAAQARGMDAEELMSLMRRFAKTPVASLAALHMMLTDAEPIGADNIREALEIYPLFRAGNTTVKGGAPPAEQAANTSALEIKAGPKNKQSNAKVYIAEGDIRHYKSGHSYPDYALTRSNIRRADVSTMFPLDLDITAAADQALRDNQARLTRQMGKGLKDYRGAFGENYCGFQVVGPEEMRMTQFYPANGFGEPRSKLTLLAVKALVQP